MLIRDHLPKLGADLVTGLATLDVDEFTPVGRRRQRGWGEHQRQGYSTVIKLARTAAQRYRRILEAQMSHGRKGATVLVKVYVVINVTRKKTRTLFFVFCLFWLFF